MGNTKSANTTNATNTTNSPSDQSDPSYYVPPKMVPNISIIKSYSDLEILLGKPNLINDNKEPFFSRSVDEDCFLCAGWRNTFGKRYEWEHQNNYVVCYVDSNNKFVKVFETSK